MATRKSEWLASIKPILDRDAATRDAKDLARELSDILDVSVGTDTDSLEQLTKEFNRQLKEMGKQEIVFSEKTLHGIVGQFAAAITEGIVGGIAGGIGAGNIGQIADKIGDGVGNAIRDSVGGAIDDVSKEMTKKLTELENRRAEIHKHTEKLDKRYQKYSDMYDILSRDEEANISPLKVEEDIDEQALKILEDFTNAEDALTDAEERRLEAEKALKKVDRTDIDAKKKAMDALKQSTQEYNTALVKAAKAAVDMYRMGETLKQNDDKVKDRRILSDFSEKGIFETTSDVSDKWMQYFEGYDEVSIRLLKKLKLELADINAQIEEIHKNHPEIIDVAVVNKAVKSLDEIAAAYDRIAKKAKKANTEAAKDVLEAIEYEPGSQSLTVLKNKFIKARDSGADWEEQYKWLVKFVKEYDARLAKINAEENKQTKSNKLQTFMKNKEVQELYGELSPMSQSAEQMLREIAKRAGHQFDGGAAGGSGSGGGADEAERIAEAEKRAREESEKKILSDEASAEANSKAADEAERELRAKEAAAKAEEERQKLLKNKDAIATMHDTPGEAGAFFNSKTGEFSDVIGGGDHSVETERSAWEEAAEAFNARIHKHNYDVAAPSFSGEENDFNVWIKGFDIFKKQMILANKEILSFDFSSLESVDILKEIARKYKEAATVIDQEFDGYIKDRKVGEIFGTADNMNEQMQVRLREVLDNIMVQFPGVMTSYQLPEDMIKRPGQPVSDVGKKRPQDVRNEAIAHVDNADAINTEAQAQENLNEAKASESTSDLVSRYDASSDEIKKKYQELIAIQDQIDELEDKTQKTSIDIDPWNATKEQKEQIVAAWREYQKVIQEIAAMPIVETEDDEKRLLELKAKAVSLYETMYQGHLNDVTGDGYSKEYGLSAAEGGQMHVDMQAEPRKDFDKSLGGLQSKLNDAYLAAQKLDGEMYKMMLHADDDSIENLYEKIRQDALDAKPAVEAVGDAMEETKNAAQGTGDASSAELEAAVTKTDALQDEVEQKNKELADKEAEIARVRAENEARLKTEADEKARLQEDLNATNQQLTDVKHENELYDTALAKANEESNVKDGIIRELREQLANVKTGVSEEQASVSSEELKNVLSSIVYNVKIAHDDNDKQANKIALDEGALENTLKRVFANILGAQVKQVESEPKNEPWALEKTLLGVKEVLGNIQTNTAKPESIEVAPAKTEVGNVLATENTLVAIKSAVEAIKSKTNRASGTKTSDGGRKNSGSSKKNSESFDGSRYFPEKLKTQTMQLAKFRAQLMTTGKLTDDVDTQIYELLDALAQVKSGPDFSEWSQKFQQLKTSVGITDIFDKAEDKDITASYKQLIEYQKERNKLELQYEKSQEGTQLKQFYAEQLAQMDAVIAKQEELLDNEEQEAKLAKIRAEQERKLGEIEAKAADKADKKRAADAKKLAKRQAMTGKAGSAIGRAETTWLEAESLDQAKLPEGFKKQVKEYYDALDKLRVKHSEVDAATTADEIEKLGGELVKQTATVNKLTSELAPLIAQYERLSGDNTEVIGASMLGPNATLEEYEQGLRQAVMTATNGKAQIKSFDHETKTLTYTLKTGKHEFTEYTAEVRNLDKQYISTAGKTKHLETFLEATKRKMKELTSYFSGMAVFNRVGQELRRGIQYVREIDLALTELRKVTDETEETYDRFLETAAKTADKVGSTIQKVVSSTADWARLGSILAKTNIRPVM